MKRHYCLIETGLAPKALVPRHGTYPSMGKNLMEQCLQPFDWSVVSPIREEPLPQPEAFDGYMIMGSEFSVNDDSLWVKSLLAFIVEVVRKRTPLVGICFGHQAIAKALGGTVNRGNWNVGATSYQNEAIREPLTTIAYHEDHVIAAPPETELLLTSTDCRIASLRYRSCPCWTIQSHPEFSPEFARDLFEHTRGRPLSDDLCERAIASVEDLRPNLDPVYQQIRLTFEPEDPPD